MMRITTQPSMILPRIEFICGKYSVPWIQLFIEMLSLKFGSSQRKVVYKLHLLFQEVSLLFVNLPTAA